MVKPSKKIIMHNCCFLTILNELTFLLYPLDTRRVLNRVLHSGSFLWSINRVSSGALLAPLLSPMSLQVKELPRVGDAVQWLFLSSLLVNRKEAWREGRAGCWEIEKRKEKSNPFLPVVTRLNSVTGLQCSQPRLCGEAEAECLGKGSIRTVS